MTFITSGPLVAMVLEGEQAVAAARQVIGATNPLEATTGSIRGDYAIEVGQNMVHGSDSPESAAREVALFFPDAGLMSCCRDGREPAGARVALAAAARDPRAAGRRVLGPGPPTSRSSRRAAARGGARERLPQGVGGRRRRREGWCSASTRSSSLGARMYGKPADAEEARATLRALAGRRHAVISGVCLIEDGQVRSAAAQTGVAVPGAGRRPDRLVPGQRRMARARRRLRDPGTRRGARGGDRGRLPQRGRPAGGDAARAGARVARLTGPPDRARQPRSAATICRFAASADLRRTEPVHSCSDGAGSVAWPPALTSPSAAYPYLCCLWASSRT